MKDWHTRDIADIALETGTDTLQGRINVSADRKRKKNNTAFLLPTVDPSVIMRKMMSDASLMLLAVSYVIFSCLGNFFESLTPIALIAVAYFCGSYIKYRSSLRIVNSYRMLLPSAKVIEAGKNIRLSVFDIEVGDLICFSQGDIIPADARLVSSDSLSVAERGVNEITGRSEYKSYSKDHNYLSVETEESHCANMVYAGSMVISGKGSAIVSDIGKDTEIYKKHNGFSIVSENDSSQILDLFLRKSKQFSLVTLVVIVLSFLFTALIKSPSPDLLSIFILAVSLAATTMSELSVASSEAIVTKELLTSSLVVKSDKDNSSKITKLASAEKIAQTDTILILCPDVLIDERKLVRRIFFSGKKYQSDLLNSQQINDFVRQITPFYSLKSPNFTIQDEVVKDFVESIGCENSKTATGKFIKNFPISGARTYVREFDTDGKPIRYITKMSDIALLRKCTKIRTEGGGEWALDENDYLEIENAYKEYRSSSLLDTLVFYSFNPLDTGMIFEGIIAVGGDYPYRNGDFAEELIESGVQPILVLEEESPRNLDIAQHCGLVVQPNDIAVCSQYQIAGMSVTDASLSTKVYVGFGRNGTRAIAQRLAQTSKKVLPVIKNSANRLDVSPLDTYATHSVVSFDSVKIATSVSIAPVTSDKDGGLFDVLKSVRSCSMAFLKLGIYKNYLVFSSIFRLIVVFLPLLLGYYDNMISPTATLIGGLFCDFTALLSIMYNKGVPVKAQNTMLDAKRMFYWSSSFVASFCSLLIAVISLCTLGYLTGASIISKADASIVMALFVLFSEMSALGGFLLILHGKSRLQRINPIYLFAILTLIIIAFLSVFTPSVGLAHQIIPYLAGISVASSVVIVIILGNLSSFAHHKLK